MNNTRSLFISWIIAAALAPSLCGAQEMAVPVDVQYLIFAKILGFDRNLAAGGQADLRVGVIYQKKTSESLRAKDLFFEAARKNPSIRVHNRALTLVPIEIAEDASFEEVVRQAQVSVLYITPLRAFDIKEVARIARAVRLVTMTGVPAYNALGIAVGLDVKGDKPQILVNLAAAKAEGMDLSSQVLKLTKIID